MHHRGSSEDKVLFSGEFAFPKKAKRQTAPFRVLPCFELAA